ncbi:MAG: YdeI/OmpD-associated family protein [Gammaproteobacteria bacterium]|nr:YdeI/OmpD-associated family protein [Gammaproteobacteria bacterium]
MAADLSRLKRQRQPMPAFVKDALTRTGLMDAYRRRPAYQQNDYLRWIGQAKLVTTRQRRLSRMLNELEAGGVYMGMAHPASARHDTQNER